MKNRENKDKIVITAGSTYLDIDAYACCVALAELLQLQGIDAIAHSNAPCNYSICRSLVEAGQITNECIYGHCFRTSKIIIVDVSDPEYISKSVELDSIVEIYDHHVGFEDYWISRIGDNAHIEFIGAAATLIYRKWKNLGIQDKMKCSTAKLLVAAILDNTLNLTSQNTTFEDIDAFNELCEYAEIDEKWCAAYFLEVQANIEANLMNSLFGDMKHLGESKVLPLHISQLSVWDAQNILEKIDDIRKWFYIYEDEWMINVIDMKHNCSYFICDDQAHQKSMEKIFNISFEYGVAKTPVSYLRKEIIKKAEFDN